MSKLLKLAIAFSLPLAAMAVTTTGYEDFGNTAGVVLWRGEGTTFHNDKVIDVAEDGTPGEVYNMDANNDATSWQRFSDGQTAYANPGRLLVYDEAGYAASSDAQFGYFTFGGLWVKALAAENTPYALTGYGYLRLTYFGAVGYTTYFKIEKSFTVDRDKAASFRGTANVEISEGATFTVHKAAAQTVSVPSGANLVLSGSGTLAVSTLSVDGTLDLSAETRPTIDGNVVLNGTIALPANTEVSAESPFQVCTGTLSGLVNVLVKIGDAEAVEKSFTAENGAITSFGDPIYEFSDNFPTVVPAGQTYTFIGGETAETAVTVPNTVTVKGILKTSGFITVPYFAGTNGAKLDVIDGTTTLICGNKALAGDVVVEAGATLVNGNTDAVDWTDIFIANIYGTLSMGATRWSLGSNSTLNFHEGCTVTGSGQQSNGTFDWIENATATLNVDGDVNLAAPIRIRGGAKVNFNVDTTDQKGLTLAATIGSGAIVKKGAGLLKFTTNPPYAITVENGAFTFGVDATPTITYSAKPGAGTTMSMWYATQATWKGTVVIGDLNAPAALPLNAYGNENSKIVLTGTTGNCYLNGTTTVAAELVVGTNATNVVEFNNGNSDQVGTFNKVSGPGTLKLTGWTGCRAATYVVNTSSEFTGTLAINNAITRDGGGTFTIRIGNIATTGVTTAGSKVLNLTQTAVDNATGTVVYDTANSTVNDVATPLAVTAQGVYVAAASSSIGGVVAYYRGVQTAFTTVNANGSAGDSVTILDGNDYGTVEGFEYNSETKTYTMLQMVAQFTSGMMTHKYITIAGACTEAAKLDPVPTVVLLVALGEQTVPYGWTYNTPEVSETTYGTLTYIPRVAQIVNGDAYVSLADAVAAAGSGATVELLDSIALAESVEIAAGKNVTIDLNGKTITGPAGGYAFSNAGEVTIENGTITGASGVAANTADGASIAVSSGSYTATGDLFANVEGATIAVSGGTFNQSVADEYLAEGYEVTDNGNGTYGVREDKGWIYAAPGYWNYTGAWTGVTPDDDDQKVTIESGAAYTASNASDGQLVTVEMTASFADVNEDEPDATLANAKGALRLGKGETDGTYTFQLLTSENSTPAWKDAAGFDPSKETDYTFVFVFDLTNKTYTAGVVVGSTTNALSIGESITAIPFAYQGDVTPVQRIDFVGSGTVSSIEGSYETPEEPPAPEGFDEDDTIGEVTLTAEQATWLNEQNNYDELAVKIATMTADAFNNAYLLNLDVTTDFSYEFKVTDVEVGDAAVTVTVSLTRTGALTENEKAKPIVGTLKLKGTASLGTAFEVLATEAVEFDADADFGDGAEETTVTVDTTETDAKFYLPVIE